MLRFFLDELINKPLDLLVPIFIFLAAVLLWQGLKKKNARTALIAWKAFTLLALFSFLPVGIGFWASLPWFGSIFVFAWIILGFIAAWTLKGKQRSSWLITLSIVSFIIPLIGLFSYCSANFPFLLSLIADSLNKVTCAYGFTTMNLASVVIECFLGVFLLISAVIIRKFSSQDNIP